jgi:hypothetical protein
MEEGLCPLPDASLDKCIANVHQPPTLATSPSSIAILGVTGVYLLDIKPTSQNPFEMRE